MDPAYATRKFVSVAQGIEHLYADPGVLAQRVQRSAFPDRYGQRAGQAVPSTSSTAPDARGRADLRARRLPGGRGLRRRRRGARACACGRDRRRAARGDGLRAPEATAQPLAYGPGAKARLAAGAIGVVDLVNRAAIAPRTMHVNSEQTLDGLR